MNSGESRQFTHNSLLSTVHSFAFTLAETLIVMGIIGVVAALTIPNVNKNTGRAEAVAKVKKIYAELNEAHSRATAVYGPIEKWSGGDMTGIGPSENSKGIKRYYDRITEFMKIQKSCRDSSDITGCMDVSYKDIYGSSYTPNYDDAQSYVRAITSGGWSFSIASYSSSCKGSGYGYSNSCGNIYVDIDGPNKGKNTRGIDVFEFLITKNGIQPFGSGEYWTDSGNYGHNVHQCFTYGTYCTEWVIRNGNMDYLDANHTSRENSGKCKNGKQLSTTVSSCK